MMDALISSLHLSSWNSW